MLKVGAVYESRVKTLDWFCSPNSISQGHNQKPYPLTDMVLKEGYGRRFAEAKSLSASPF